MTTTEVLVKGKAGEGFELAKGLGDYAALNTAGSGGAQLTVFNLDKCIVV